MRRLFVTIHALTWALHLPFAAALAELLRPWGSLLAWAIGATAALALALLFRGRVALQRWDRPVGALRRVAEEAYFVHWVALLLATALALPVLAVVRLASTVPPALGSVAGLAYLAGLPVAIAGVVVGRRRLVVDALDVPLEGLPAAFDGYRIVQLSDLHVGSLCPRRFAEAWVKAANALEPDLVVLTGDYVTTGVRFHGQIAQALARLRARDGIYAVMGNHDYFGDGEPLMTLLRESGIVLLRNERARIARGGARLCLAGLDDTFTRRADVDRALAGCAGEQPVVVLAHDPRTFPLLADRGAALVLSGHTHWGQIGLPFWAARLNLATPLMRYAAGSHRRGRALLHVSPGLGTTGLPMRLGVPPAITVVTLRSAAA